MDNKKLPILLKKELHPDEFRDIMILKDSNGWKYVQEYIDSRIEYYKSQLITTTFDNLNSVYEIQSYIKSFTEIKGIIDKIK